MSNLCPGCKQPLDPKIKQQWAKDYGYMVDGIKSPLAILFQADCYSSGLTVEMFRKARFCPTTNIKNYGFYSIREWWVWLDENTLELWSIGPGGFFRNNAKTCKGNNESYIV